MAQNDIIVPREGVGGVLSEFVLPDATTSVRGLLSAADKTKLDGIAAGAEVNVNADWNASSGDAQILNKPGSFTPSTHAASHHASTGSDPLAPSDIGAQSLFTSASQVLSADFTLTSGRATKWTLQNYNGTTYNVTLPTTNIQAGDVVVVAAGTLVGSQTIREANVGGGSFVTLATLSAGQSYRFVSTGTASNSWEIDQVYTHTHAASDITIGTLAHDRGGLEADVSAYNGLVKISGGATSAVTVTTAGEALLDDADAAAQRTTLGLGTAATAATGDFAAASHSHELTALAATGATNGHVLTANGSNGVTFAALPASGVTGAASSASDVLGVSGSNITGVDANADRIIFFDDSAGKLTHLTVGSGLSISDTTISATASGGSKTYAVFTAEHNQPPSTAFATLDTRNSIAVLDFDAATDENAVFVGIMPEAASLGSGLIVRLHWMATSATSGNVRWGVQFERSNTDLDADSFDTAVEATAAANGTSGILTTTAITVTTIDGITAGDVFRLKVFRNADDATNDTMTGDAELVAVEVRSAA